MKSLLAAAFITYMPAAPEDVRQEKLKTWMELTGRSSEMEYHGVWINRSFWIIRIWIISIFITNPTEIGSGYWFLSSYLWNGYSDPEMSVQSAFSVLENPTRTQLNCLLNVILHCFHPNPYLMLIRCKSVQSEKIHEHGEWAIDLEEPGATFRWP